MEASHTHHMQVVELRQKMAALHSQMAAIPNAALAENRSLAAEEQNQYAGLRTEYEGVKAKVQMLEDADVRSAELAKLEGALPKQAQQTQQAAQRHFNELDEKGKLIALREVSGGVNKYLRALALNPATADAELRAVMTSSTQGVPNLINTIYSNELIKTLREVGTFLASCRQISTDNGAPYDIDTRATATMVGSWIAENTLNTQTDWTYGTTSLGAKKMTTGFVTVTREALRDTSRDLMGEIMEVFGTIFDNTLNLAVTTGAGGASQPTGYMAAGQITNLVTGATGATTSITYAKLKELIHAVKLPYRKGAKFIMNDNMMKSVYDIVDTTGRPLFTEGLAYLERPSLLGYDIILNEDMASPAANAKSIAFFNPQYYAFRSVNEPLDVAVEAEPKYDRFNYMSYFRCDGKLLLPEATAAAVYTHSAT